MPSKLMEYFNRQPRIGVLSTSSRDGKVDSAIFGSPRMIDEKTVVVATARNRTLANLQENPNAVFMIMEQGAGILDWKGVRVYMKMKDCQTSGEIIEGMKEGAARAIGEEAAKMLYAAMVFDIAEVRPLIDLGQGWEKSI